MDLRRIAPLFNENTAEKRPISMILQPVVLSPTDSVTTVTCNLPAQQRSYGHIIVIALYPPAF